MTAKPNIVYTLDDSGSMQFSYLPDWVIAGAPTTAVTKITRVGATATVQVASTAALAVGQFVIIAGANQPEYNGQFQILSIPNGTTFTIAVVGTPGLAGDRHHHVRGRARRICRSGTITAACSAGAVSTFTSPPFYAASFNHLLYDPNVNYQPPVKYDGTPAHPHDRHGHRRRRQPNLLQRPAGPVHRACRGARQPDGQGRGAALLQHRLADHQGRADEQPDDRRRRRRERRELAARGGRRRLVPDQRHEVQGIGRLRARPPSPMRTERAVQLPVQVLERRHRRAVLLPAARNKVLYCDKTSPYWPKVQGAITGCTLGGTPTCGGLPCAPVITKQTCNLSTPGKTCNPTTALRNFTPAVCKTPSALYCLPGVGGSDGNSPGTGTAPECLPCTCNADYQPASTKKCSVVGQRVHVRVRHAGLRLRPSAPTSQ